MRCEAAGSAHRSTACRSPGCTGPCCVDCSCGWEACDAPEQREHCCQVCRTRHTEHCFRSPSSLSTRCARDHDARPSSAACASLARLHPSSTLVAAPGSNEPMAWLAHRKQDQPGRSRASELATARSLLLSCWRPCPGRASSWSTTGKQPRSEATPSGWRPDPRQSPLPGFDDRPLAWWPCQGPRTRHPHTHLHHRSAALVAETRHGLARPSSLSWADCCA